MTDVNSLEATGQSSWGSAPLDAVQDGIKYLRTSQGGNKACGAPPHTCVRISCSWHGGIHLCSNVSICVSLIYVLSLRSTQDMVPKM